jgi:uncharacterized FAD-dependent dehydrogenase
MIRVNGIRRRAGEPMEVVPERLARRCRLAECGYRLKSWKISRESIDARDKGDVCFVYSVDFEAEPAGGARGMAACEDAEREEAIARIINKRSGRHKVALARSLRYSPFGEARGAGAAGPAFAPDPGRGRPVIAGFGPCGMFAGLILAEHGFRPIILERGKPIEQRASDVERLWRDGVLDPESNVQFGEGGAGAFSDGKLTTGVNDPRAAKALEEFVEAGGGEDLLRRAKPHIGTDVLPRVVENIRRKIISMGGEVRFGSKLVGLKAEAGALSAALARTAGGDELIPARDLILAIGHSARDTFKMLLEAGLAMERKPFSIGLRIEHPQKTVNAAQYGDGFASLYGMAPEEAGLPPAEYKLSHRCGDGRGLYTFCMCPGGRVISAASHEGMTVTNGMSGRARDGEFANSALLVDVRVDDFASGRPLAGVEFQETYERLAFEAGGGRYTPPKEATGDFLKAGSLLAACLPGFAAAGIREGLPELGKKLRGFDAPDGTLYGVETRSSSPLRIARSKELVANIGGVYPGGEGAGYAGGIMSAAIDGIKIAEKVICGTGRGTGNSPQ